MALEHPPPSPSLKVLLTRLTGENDTLATRLREAGHQVRELPLLAIQALEEAPEQRALILNIDQFNAVITTSKHASRLLLERLDEVWPQLPVGLHWYAIGEASAAVLQQAGLPVEQPPTGHTSEDLLQHPRLQQLAQQKLLLVKGMGGRDLLATELRQRGAQVSQLPLYRRDGLDHPEPVLQELLAQWQPDIAVTLSGETLQQLWSQCRKIGYSLQTTRIVVPSARVAGMAQELNLHVSIAGSLKDDDLVRQIAQGQ